MRGTECENVLPAGGRGNGVGVHLSDEILPPLLWMGGYVGAAAVGAVAIRSLRPESVPRVAVVTSAFVVASYIHIPLPVAGTSVHLVLNGLVGILLGPAALPAIVVALFLHALGGHGGIQPLGVMTLALGSGALLGHWIFRVLGRHAGKARAAAAGFLAGAVAVYWSAFIIFGALWIAGESLHVLARLVLAAYGVLAIVEGIVTAVTVSFLATVKPSLLRGPTEAGR